MTWLGWVVAAVLAIAWWTAECRRAITRTARIERLIERADAALAASSGANRRQAELWVDLADELSALQAATSAGSVATTDEGRSA
jgi:hypothetical protein